MILELPQCPMLSDVLIWGLTDSVCPVHASSAFLCATIQSNRPSRCMTVKLVSGDLVEIRAVKGVVEDTLW